MKLARLLDKLDTVDRLDLNQNPWEHPPEAIVAGDLQAVRGYYDAIFLGGTTAVTRPLKVVIVGKETVGKTRYEGHLLISSVSLVLHVHTRLLRNSFLHSSHIVDPWATSTDTKPMLISH